MTGSSQGASIFASIINSEEDYDDNAGDQEIQNITTFHSPLEGLLSISQAFFLYFQKKYIVLHRFSWIARCDPSYGHAT